MKNLLKQHYMMLISCVLLTSCASVSEDTGLGPDIDFRGSDCISIRTIRDYTPLDSRTLLIDGGGRRNYLVTLTSPAVELRSSMRLEFVSRDNSLCPYGGDRLVFGGLSSFDVMIRGISRVSPEQVEDLLIRYGRKEPEEQQDQAPAKVKGAEVEELGQIE